MIEDDSLVYERVTSSYPLNLPTDYYHSYIRQTLPSKEKEKVWFIRPHHLETLTEHPNSIKDDILNTRYFSHYNIDHGKKVEVNEAEIAISNIEEHLNELKNRSFAISASRG
jgi:hypothetical protein